MMRFEKLLTGAKRGDAEAMDKLLLICKDVLDAGCYINGVPDEELRELIYFRFVQAVHQFDENRNGKRTK